MYSIPSATGCFPLEFMPSAYNNTFQHVRGDLLVCSFFNSHHQGLIATFLWQPVVWCSRGYPWVTPLLCPRKTNSRKYPTYLTCPILPSIFNIITMQHKGLKSFNLIPLKSHTKYVHLSPLFPSLSKENSFPYPTQFFNASPHPQPLPLSPFPTYHTQGPH